MGVGASVKIGELGVMRAESRRNITVILFENEYKVTLYSNEPNMSPNQSHPEPLGGL